MDADDCAHYSVENGVCTGCGLCLDDTVFVDQFPSRAHIPNPNSSFKFVQKDKIVEYRNAIAKILVPLDLSCYTDQILALLQTAKFTIRLSSVDKICILTYRVCTMEGCPVTIDDILQFTRLAKPRLLKAYRDTFSYEQASPSYLTAVYERGLAFAKSLGVSTRLRLPEFIELARHHRSANVRDLSIAAILHTASNGYTFKSLSIVPLSRKERIRKLIKKLKLT